MSRISSLPLALLLILVSCSDGGDVVQVPDLNETASVPDVEADTVLQPTEITEDGGFPIDLFEVVAPDVAGEVEGPQPGEIGWDCDQGDDCFSGVCLQTLEGAKCTGPCQDECPFGWVCSLYTPSQPDILYLCVPPFVELCRPCKANTDCWSNGVDGGQACLVYGAAGNFCGGPCESDDDCRQGYECLETMDVTGGTTSQCRRSTGECACQPWHADALATTDCYAENDEGICYGQRQCKATGLTSCDAAMPAAESCNGLDDNCDGTIDEGTDGGECFVTNQFGSCPGVYGCEDGALQCDGAEPHAETCDGEDNDCDGVVDEGFLDTDGDGVADCLESDIDGDGIPDVQDNCPGIHNATQADLDLDNFGDACDADDDNDGTGDGDDCAPLDGAIHPGADETCNGLDDNCNFLVDEGYKDSDFDGWKDCVDDDDDGDGTVDGDDCEPLNPAIHPAAVELCDGIDNNCSDTVDEGFDDTDEDGVADCADNDVDGDGVADDEDNCPQTANEDQADGDKDGIGDACDGDVDGDGISDGLDNCPTTFNPNQQDLDGDGIGNPCDDDIDGDGTANDADCSPADALVHPGAVETCDAFDNDCDDEVDEELGVIGCGKGQCAHEVPACVAGKAGVCDPFEGIGEEICDGADNDCNGLADEGLGSTSCGLGLCAHTVVNCLAGQIQLCDPLAGAGDEVCDGLDNDCDGKTDEDQATLACGKGQCFHTVGSCSGGVEVECNPFAGASPEVCDGIDNDCDGDVDEGLGTVLCGLGECAHEMAYCADGKVVVCNPYLGVALEVCDGLDNDCDGLVDEDLLPLNCGLGECAKTVPSCVEGEVQQCDPMAGAGEEICDGKDNDCDGQYDEALGYLTCGQGVCLHTVPACLDGEVQECDPLAGAGEEVCDGLDNDCDGLIDPEGATDCTVYHYDVDGDGFGLTDSSKCLCKAETPFTSIVGGDCNDDSADISPAASEDCSNMVDDNCSGQINEDCTWTSCKAVLAAMPQAPSGPYMIDVDGDGETEPFQAWCDMTTDGGGWTLLMKTSSASEYVYGNAVWTVAGGGSAGSTDPAVDEDYVSAAFYLLSSTESRIALGAQNQWNSWYHAKNTARNLANQSRMAGSYAAAATCAARTNCGTEPVNKRPLGVQEGTSSSSSNKWNRFGYVNDVNGWGTRTRVGFTGDNDGSDSSDSVMGLGIECTSSCLSGSCTGAAHGKGSGFYLYQSWASSPFDGAVRGWLWMR